MIFAVLTLVSALSISVIAAYFSIIGLATIFPGSIEAVIAMGAALEIGKIVAAIWLHKNWKSAPTTLKIYLFSAILVLMGITSMGIFGFLSKSHIEHEQNAEKAAALVTQVETKINREQEYIARQKELIQQNEDKNQNRSDKSAENIELEQKKIAQLTEQLEKDIELDQKMLAPIAERLKQMNEDLAEVQNKPGGLFSNKKKELEDKISEQASEREELASKKKDIEDRISKYRDETSALISDIRKRIQEYQNIGFEKPENVEQKIEQLNKNIASALDRIDELERQKFDLDDGSRQLEAEVGPVKYVAELVADFTGMDFDIGKAVRMVIIILIFVFDPLAVLLVLAAHISLSKKFPKAMQDEAIVFEKIAEMELQSKAIEQEELDLEERKKDIEQERKMIELNENQIKKYQQEISDSKETLRKLKLEAQKQLLEQEDTSAITAELEQLMSQKQIAEEEIKEIKIQKNKILSKADETIKSAREIKQVLGNHKENKEKIEQLKSEICINIEQFEKLKNQIHALESTNKDLDANRINLESTTASLETQKQNLEAQAAELESEKAELLNKNSDLETLVSKLEAENEEFRNTPIPDPNPELKNKIAQLIDQKNELLEENLAIKNQKLLAVQIHSIDNKHFELIVPSSISGKHVFKKEDDYTQDQISKFISLSEQIDKECPDRDQQQLEATYNKKIISIVDSRMSNRDYRKHRPNYFFSA
jgi:chromosome segregation ATPase